MGRSFDRVSKSTPLLSLLIFLGLLGTYVVFGTLTGVFAQEAPCYPPDSYPCTGFSDLSLVKTESQDPVVEGNQFSYQITINNTAATTNIQVTDNLPTGVAFVGANTQGGAGGSCTYDSTNHRVTCTWTSVGDGETLGITITVQAGAQGLWDNQATVTHDAADPNTNNNTDAERTTISRAPARPQCDDDQDNDLDGLVDFDGGQSETQGDPDCTSPEDPTESSPPQDRPSPSPSTSSPSPSPSTSSSQSPAVPGVCGDNLDNDGDGLFDFDGGPNGQPPDPGCASIGDDDETNPTSPPPDLPECGDGINNDPGDDQSSDENDPDCTSADDDDEGGVHPRCGLPGVICGTDGPDLLKGDSGPNEIYGGDGDDVCIGGGGNDIIVCFAGNDVIRGGRGNDTLSSTTGNDKIYGGRGRDFLRGRRGNDLLNGGRGRDRCRGGPGNDRLKSC